MSVIEELAKKYNLTNKDCENASLIILDNIVIKNRTGKANAVVSKALFTSGVVNLSNESATIIGINGVLFKTEQALIQHTTLPQVTEDLSNLYVKKF